MVDFSGRWVTSFGPMELAQDGLAVKGHYLNRDRRCPIEGAVVGERLRFRYEEPGEQGTGWLALTRYGKFAGKYTPDGTNRDGLWVGQREFDGIWESSFGRLRLIQEEDRVFGYYEGVGSSTIEGTIVDGEFRFHYQEPQAAGEGKFVIDPGYESFTGQWRPLGVEQWSQWVGKRILPQSNRTWLLVLEAHWQRSIAEEEYSFGQMLSEFLDRHEHVAVRHRFFDDAAGLDRWCRELLYFPEPAVVLIASHGTSEGINVQGRTIDSKRVIDSLRHAENLMLLHFSACLVMKEEHPGDFAKRIQRAAPFPISGYTTSVDWGGSAVLEFNYLDMILGKSIPPERAADNLLKLINYAGDTAPEGSPYPGAGFRFLSPAGKMTAAPEPAIELPPPGMNDVFLA
jgi:hypothetical protein